MTDLAIRLFLHDGALVSDCKKELYIINRDSSVIDRYTELLGNAFDIKDEFVGDNAIEKFVKRSRIFEALAVNMGLVRLW